MGIDSTDDEKKFAWIDHAKCKQLFLLTDEECAACETKAEIQNANTRKVHNLFFPVQGDTESAGKAVKICEQCDVRGECLTMSLEMNERIGIWGGTSGRTRRRISRMKNIVRLTQTIIPDEEE